MSSRFTFYVSLFIFCASLFVACAAPITQVPTATLTPPENTQPPPSATLVPSPLPPTSTPIPPTFTPEPPTPTATPASINPAEYRWRRVADGLTEPVLLTHAGDSSGRTFIVEQPGVIKILQNGQVLAEPFLDIRDRVNDGANEQGLLGLAFHPQYAANGWFFVNYTGAQGQTVIARFTANGNVADVTSERIVLEIAQPYANHNGGHVAFGPDGFLYIGLGDGGSAGDPQDFAQNLQSLLGKMLRLDVNTEPYAIPPGNPFVSRSDIRPEIWSFGWRNPWRFSFDRATGDMYVADVGQNSIEEVSFQSAASAGGENYGWRFLEGTGAYLGTAPEGLVAPIAGYTHAEGGCSVTGGYVYRGPTLTDLNGVYVFGDYCTGLTWSLRLVNDVWERREFMDTDFVISSFGEDEAGELYLLNHRAGEVYQLVHASD